MRNLFVLAICLLLCACKQKNNAATSPTSLPTVEEKTGIYQSATVYAASTDYEFLVDGKPFFVRVNYSDSLNIPDVPTNLTVMGMDGPPDTNPLLIGQKYELTFGPSQRLKSIRLAGAHDPSSPDIPAIPETYSGLFSIGSDIGSRAYLSLYSDLVAVLLVAYDSNKEPYYKVGNWTRTKGGLKVAAQFGAETWEFLVREKALVLSKNPMNLKNLNLVATENYDLCHYTQQWLSDLSTMDGEKRVPTETITQTTPLSEVLRTEHAYMSLYGTLETVFLANETDISEALRANPTVGGVCNLIVPAGGH